MQNKACGALWNLAINDANKATLVEAKAHLRIIRAMDLYQNYAKVQTKSCGALASLAANETNQVTLMVAVPSIIRAMDRHQDDAKLETCRERWECFNYKGLLVQKSII